MLGRQERSLSFGESWPDLSLECHVKWRGRRRYGKAFEGKRVRSGLHRPPRFQSSRPSCKSERASVLLPPRGCASTLRVRPPRILPMKDADRTAARRRWSAEVELSLPQRLRHNPRASPGLKGLPPAACASSPRHRAPIRPYLSAIRQWKEPFRGEPSEHRPGRGALQGLGRGPWGG